MGDSREDTVEHDSGSSERSPSSPDTEAADEGSQVARREPDTAPDDREADDHHGGLDAGAESDSQSGSDDTTRTDSDAADTVVSFEEEFDHRSVADVDGNRVLTELLEPSTATGDDADETREIDKRRFCHQCEYFDEPPSFGCTHPDTTILELTSIDTVRVRNCPVAREEHRLEDDPLV